ncbi:hypothetical protein [Roseomonas sp. WA12]
MSTARLGSWPANSGKGSSRGTRGAKSGKTASRVQAPAPESKAACDPRIEVVNDLVRYARAADLVLADEILTDILGKLHGWPVEELNRLS